jgi:hypothetical protein
VIRMAIQGIKAAQGVRNAQRRNERADGEGGP